MAAIQKKPTGIINSSINGADPAGQAQADYAKQTVAQANNPPLASSSTKLPVQPINLEGKLFKPISQMPLPTTNPGAQTPAGSAGSTAPDTAPVYTPTNIDVNPATDTVQGQVSNIIDQNSPLMQQAATRGLQAANSRGLLNSSMAVQAGQAAVLDAAMPMAQQDAATYAHANEVNTGAKNEFSLQGLRGDQAKELSQIENQWHMLMQTSQSASTIMSTAYAAIGEILGNPDIPANQKDALIKDQTEMLSSTMYAVGSIGNLNLGNILKFKQ